MTILEQYSAAEKTKAFLTRWGLKSKFVAEACQIPETAFSKFLNNKAALTDKQVERITAYVDDYVRRNS